MTFEEIQNRIAEKILKVKTEIEKLESIGLDYDIHSSVKLDARIRALTENQHFLQQLAFFIISQDEEILMLKDENARGNTRIAALLGISERTILKANAAQAVTRLHQSKWDHLTRETENWLKEELGEDYIIHQELMAKIAA